MSKEIFDGCISLILALAVVTAIFGVSYWLGSIL